MGPSYKENWRKIAGVAAPCGICQAASTDCQMPPTPTIARCNLTIRSAQKLQVPRRSAPILKEWANNLVSIVVLGPRQYSPSAERRAQNAKGLAHNPQSWNRLVRLLRPIGRAGPDCALHEAEDALLHEDLPVGMGFRVWGTTAISREAEPIAEGSSCQGFEVEVWTLDARPCGRDYRGMRHSSCYGLESSVVEGADGGCSRGCVPLAWKRLAASV